MSIALMTQVWALPLPTGEKIVLLALADQANDTGHCWPSMATIAKRAGMTDRGAQLIVQRLEANGHLHRVQVIGKGCNYYIHPRTSCAPEHNSPPNVVPPERPSQTPERRSDKPSVTLNPSTDASHPTKEARAKAKRAVRCPDDWMPAPLPKDLATAVAVASPGWIERQLAGMRDWSASSPNGAKSDWNAAWRNWLRREIDKGINDGNANHGNRGRLGGSDKPPVYRRSIGLEMLRELRGDIEADAGPQGGDSGTGLTLPMPARH